MSDYLIEYQVRIRNRADTADLLLVTSVSAVNNGTNPYIKAPPRGDGASFNPMTGDQMAGSYSVLVVDAITSGTDRVVTSKLEDVNALLRLGFLKTYIETRSDGGIAVPAAGLVAGRTYTITSTGTTDFTLVGAASNTVGLAFTATGAAAGTGTTTRWESLTVGYLTLLRLVDAVTWEFTVQDALRALEGVELFNAQSLQTIESFLAEWPNRGCLYGGPVLGEFLTWKDKGGWQMTVRDGRGASGQHMRYWLDPVTIYGPGNWRPHSDLEDVKGPINEAAATLRVGTLGGLGGYNAIAYTTIADAIKGNGGLVAIVERTPGATPEYFRAICLQDANEVLAPLSDIVLAGQKKSGVFIYLDNQAALTLGSVITVRCLTILPTEVCPIYIDRHPIDLLSDLCAIAGLGFSASAGAAVKALIGSGLRVSLRITGSQKMGDLLRAAVFSLGIGVRQDSSGRVAPFSMRRLSNAAPTKTIDDSLIVEGSVRTPFEQDVSVSGLQRFTFAHRHQFFERDTPDGVREVDETYTELNPDANPLLSGTVETRVPGMVRHDPSVTAPVDAGWVAGEARILFERFGRASQAAEFDLSRGDGTTDADTADYGEEILVAIKQLPNHNKRLGDDGSVAARAMQIVRLQESASRRPVRVVDSGPNAQPLATKPTHTIAASTDLPRTVAQATVTNAATLNGLGYAARIQLAVVAHGAGAPAASAYSDFLMTREGAIPTVAIRMPGVIAGSDVYVRARSELTGHRPSDYSTGVKVSLSGVDDPTSVAAAAASGDGSREDLSWVIGANAGADLTDIFVRLATASFDVAVRVATVLAGSTHFRLANLVPSTNYIASVQHRDPATQDVSDPVDVAFTTDAGVATIGPPTSPIGFSGVQNGEAQMAPSGVYGLAVVASVFPSSIEYQEAVEDSIGSGTYGSFTTVGILASVPEDFTAFAAEAPNDRLHRKLRSRVVRDPSTMSGWTVPQTVLPWSYAPLIVQEEQVSLNNFKWTDSSDGLTRTYTMVAGDRIHRVAVFIKLASVPPTADPWPPVDDAPALAAWLAAGGTMMILTPDPVTGLVTFAYTAPTVTAQAFLQFEPRQDDWTAGPVRRSVLDALAIVSTAQGTVSIAVDGAPSWSENGPAPQAYVTYAESTSGDPGDAAAIAGPVISGRNVARSGGAALTGGQTLYVRIVPWTVDGVALPSILLQGAYQTFTATKTTTYSVGAWQLDPAYSTTKWSFATGYIQNENPAVGPGIFVMFPVLPDGVTITSVALTVRDTAAGNANLHIITLSVYRVTHTAMPNIGSASDTRNAGLQTLTVGLAEDTTGQSYFIQGAWTTDAFTNPGELQIGSLAITYSMPNPKAAL